MYFKDGYNTESVKRLDELAQEKRNSSILDKEILKDQNPTLTDREIHELYRDNIYKIKIKFNVTR